MSGDLTTVRINCKVVELSGPEPDVADTQYWLIRLQDSTIASLQEVQDAGVTLISHEGENVYLCRYTSTELGRLRGMSAIKSIHRYPASAKIHQDLEDEIKFLLEHPAETNTGSSANSVPIAISISLHEGEPEEMAARIARELVADGRAGAKDTTSGPGHVSTVISSDVLSSIAAFDSVHVISPQSEKGVFNDLSCEILAAECPQLWSQKINVLQNDTIFDGSGQTLAVGDSGFDNGTAWSANRDIHTAFDPAKITIGFCPSNPKPNEPSVMEDKCSHGTHVAASAVGFAQSQSSMAPKGRRIQGTAPGASLVITQLADNNNAGKFKADNAKDVFNDAYNAGGARIFNESWGSALRKDGTPYKYDKAQWIDDYIMDHPDAVVCWAAGNDGRKTKEAQRIAAEASAKNIITVGACQTSRLRDADVIYTETGLPGDAATISKSSSVGFVLDTNRIKPDVVAPGQLILSARSRSLSGDDLKEVDDIGKSTDQNYMFMSGTSMASPMVAGCAAVLRQAVKTLKPAIGDPSSALIKALIVNGAVPLVHQKSPKGFYIPDFTWGFGRVNLQASLQHLQDAPGGTPVRCGLFDGLLDIGQGMLVAEFTVPDSKTIDLTGEEMRSRLKATLVYIDKPHEKIQHRLYLKVVRATNSGKNYWYGNRAKGTSEDSDSTRGDPNNNVQQVIWPNMSPDKYRIEVEADYNYANWVKVRFAIVWFLSSNVDSYKKK